MGKSPGKWIKTVLFGKKTSKSFPKNAATENKRYSDAKAPSGVLAVDPPAVVDLLPQTTYGSGENTEMERGASANLSCDAVVLSGKQVADTEGVGGLNSANDGEIIRQEQAATKAQAAFRGYLARRAFRALKGIIRLQALIRGHLVRRQAVATLRCMQAIVKFQALLRGRQVRLSDAGFEVLKNCRSRESMVQQESKQLGIVTVKTLLSSEKLSRNTYVCKLVSSSITVMPLSLQYDVVEPNSVRNWLERWSSSRFWEPLARPKKSINSKHQKRMQTVERESGRPKRGVHRVPALNGDSSSSLHSSYESEKPKGNQRRALSHQIEATQDQPRNELERVKRSLRKVSASSEEASKKSEPVRKMSSPAPVVSKHGSDNPDAEASKKSEALKKVSSPAPVVSKHGSDNPDAEASKKSEALKKVSSPALVVPTQGSDVPLEKTSDPPVVVSEPPMVESPPKPLTVDEPTEMLHDHHPASELLSSEGGEKVPNIDKVNEELSSKEDQSKENPKTRRRRSFPVKQEYPENVSQNSPTLPSYMLATESAKAKLRAQGSPRLDQDGAENGFVRRHSLPSANGKVSSLSPRVQKPVVQPNGKGGSRSDRSLLSSRDEKVIQPGWRR